MSFTQVTVTGTYLQVDGTPASGSVTFTLTASITDGTTIVSGSPRKIELDASGSFTVQMPANDDSTTSPQNTLYQVAEQINSGKIVERGYYVALAKAVPSVNIAALAPALPQNPTFTYLTQSTGDGRYDAKGALVFNVKDYGAKGDWNGTTGTDDSAAINACIAAAKATMPGSGYGTAFLAVATVLFPPGNYYCTALSTSGKVRLTGNGARLVASGSGYILSVSGESVEVDHLMFDGHGIATGASGIYVQNAHAFHFHDLKFQDLKGSAIYEDTNANGNVDNVFAENCLTGQDTLTGYQGVVHMAGIDCAIRDVELSAADGTGLSATGFACALAVTGGNSVVGPGIQAESSDVGVYVNTPSNAAGKFVGIRADINYTHGYLIAGGVGTFSACHSYRNGQAAINTYNGFQVTAGNFTFNGCIAEGTASDMLIGFNDTQNSDANKNWYPNCRSIGHSLKAFNNAAVGARISLPPSPIYISLTAGATTWSVDQLTDILAPNTSATTVTALTNGFYGQVVRIWGDGHTTMQNNSVIINSAGADLLLAAGKMYTYHQQKLGATLNTFVQV